MSQRRASLDLAILCAFCAFLFYYGLGAFGLVGADEPRYAQVAREMLARHDWVTPILNGQPWLEKPILLYWEAMVSYALFGVHDWAARVPAAFDATLMVVAIYLVLRRIRPGIALDAALITASATFVFAFARGASTDMPLAASFAVALLGWLGWFVTRHKGYLAAFYVFLGLATLAKGPVAVGLAGLVLLVFIALRRGWSLIGKSLWAPGMVLWAAVTLPWYVLVQLRTPQFFQVFFIEHNLERYATNMFHHRQPFWYFVPVLALGLLPWTAFAIAGMARACRRWRDVRESEPAAAVPLFLAVWAAAPVVFFSTSQSKLPGYILPAIAAWTILAAEYLHERWVASEERATSRTVTVALHALAAGVFLGAVLLAPNQMAHLKAKPPGTAIAIAVLAAVIVAVALLGRGIGALGRLRTLTLAAAILVVGFIVKLAAPLVDATQSARSVEQVVERAGSAKLPVTVYKARREVVYGLNFYQNRAIPDLAAGAAPAGKYLLVVPDALREEAEVRVMPACAVERGHADGQRLTVLLVGDSQLCAGRQP